MFLRSEVSAFRLCLLPTFVLNYSSHRPNNRIENHHDHLHRPNAIATNRKRQGTPPRGFKRALQQSDHAHHSATLGTFRPAHWPCPHSNRPRLLRRQPQSAARSFHFRLSRRRRSRRVRRTPRRLHSSHDSRAQIRHLSPHRPHLPNYPDPRKNMELLAPRFRPRRRRHLRLPHLFLRALRRLLQLHHRPRHRRTLAPHPTLNPTQQNVWHPPVPQPFARPPVGARYIVPSSIDPPRQLNNNRPRSNTDVVIQSAAKDPLFLWRWLVLQGHPAGAPSFSLLCRAAPLGASSSIDPARTNLSDIQNSNCSATRTKSTACHPDRSGPAFSLAPSEAEGCVRFLHAGLRSGGISLRFQIHRWLT